MTHNPRSGVHVLALAAEAFGGRGGIARSTRDLMTALSGMPEIAGIDILPRSQPEPSSCLPDGVRQFAARDSRPAYARLAMWLAAKRRPGIVYCGHAFMAPLAFIAARMARARLVSHVHGLEVRRTLPLSRRGALAASDLILCVSRHTAGKVVEVTGVDPRRCKVVYNTVDDRFTPGDRVAAMEKFGIPRDATVISTVSRLDPRERYKGHDLIIPLLKDLARDYPGLVYLVAGAGGDRARLERLARDADAADIARFLGFVADEDLPDLYRASDLYVMPSGGEGFGIAFVEAMACGTPALGLGLGGAVDALRDGELGRAVSEAGFPAALRAALAAPRPGRAALSARSHAVFGRSRFEARLAKAMAPLLPRQADSSKACTS